MKYSILKHLLMAGLTMSLLRVALAQPQPQQPMPPHIWGVASNGLCVGVCVRPSDWHINDFDCDIDMRNTTSNRLYIFLLPLERRYEIELRGPDGRRIPQLKPLFEDQKSISQRSLWQVREPLGRDPSLDERNSLNWFFLKDIFDVKTNGLHTLIVSVRVNAFTNVAIGRSQMRSKPGYFLLPPVTNTFNILPEQPKK